MLFNLFEKSGAHVLVDGQFGSTGKGALAAWLAHQARDRNWLPDVVISNAGPNSGHTFYHGDEKVVLKQLPTFAAAMYLLGIPLPVHLSAGAIIDPDILRKEAEQFPMMPIWVHPNAAVITPEDKEAEHSGTIAAVAGTRSGTGAALARKVQRDPNAVYSAHHSSLNMPANVGTRVIPVRDTWKLFIEVSQGFSLGLNQQFYPKCTSRECTVSQALADASLPPRSLAKAYMSIRTYPIRVGNVDGHSSGDWYWDQKETTWEEIGQAPELTTVTQRVRRVANFSLTQYIEAVRVNDPDVVFVNFMNYMDEDAGRNLLHRLEGIGRVENFLLGYGPKVEDVKWWK